MYLDDALKLLEDLYSGDDPIIFKGAETTPNELPYLNAFGYDHTLRAEHIRISYYGDEPLRLIHGTLSGMVKDRKGLRSTKEYLRRNLVHASSVGARANLQWILKRLRERQHNPKWLMKALMGVGRRIGDLPEEIAKYRDQVKP